MLFSMWYPLFCSVARVWINYRCSSIDLRLLSFGPLVRWVNSCMWVFLYVVNLVHHVYFPFWAWATETSTHVQKTASNLSSYNQSSLFSQRRWRYVHALQNSIHQNVAKYGFSQLKEQAHQMEGKVITSVVWLSGMAPNCPSPLQVIRVVLWSHNGL
jgi:hypothetical protein